MINCIGALIYFKYSSFLLSNLTEVLRTFGLSSISLHANVILPIGISFYIFQALSYTLDVYNKRVSPSNSFVDLATYISLFPQLIAGPIVRYKDVSAQLTHRELTVDKITDGIERLIIGLIKKMILANGCAVIADTIFASSAEHVSTAVAWLGAIVYSFQIYFDFSAYSDMAIGIGKMLGFDFLENFNYPYISTSIREFWRRWHISLSTWFRDYLYIPLGGCKVNEIVTYRNLLIVFFVTGLWHGASWNFIIWGLFHGLFLIIERNIKAVTFLGINIFKRVYTILVILIGWVIFRTETILESKLYILNMFSPNDNQNIIFNLDTFLTIENIIILSLCILFSTPVYLKFKQKTKTFSNSTGFAGVYYSFLIALFLFTMMYISVDTYNPFIYFRF